MEILSTGYHTVTVFTYKKGGACGMDNMIVRNGKWKMENGNGKHGKKIISIGCLYPNSQKNRSNEYDKRGSEICK